METKQCIYERRSIRSYDATPIAEKDMMDILEAGMMAPSGENFQPWYYVVIQSEEKMKELVEMMGSVSEKMEPNLKKRFVNHPHIVDETTKFMRKLGNAPVCVLVFLLKPDYTNKPSTMIQSVAASIQNMLLAAWDKGIGSCWLTAPVETESDTEIRDHFAPGKGDLVALVTFGYSSQKTRDLPRKEGRYVII